MRFADGSVVWVFEGRERRELGVMQGGIYFCGAVRIQFVETPRNQTLPQATHQRHNRLCTPLDSTGKARHSWRIAHAGTPSGLLESTYVS